MKESRRPVERVDPFVGTDSDFRFSHGNVLPLMAMPWGAHHFSPSNATPDGWYFKYRERAFCGLRLTHQPSPWMGDWCALTLLPQTGARRTSRRARALDLPSGSLSLAPHRFACRLGAPGLEWEAAPTRHGLAMRIRFEGSGERRLIFDSARSDARPRRRDLPIRIAIDPERGEVRLHVGGGNGAMHPGFGLHLLLRTGTRCPSGGVFDADGEYEGRLEARGNALGGWLALPRDVAEVAIHAAGSFIDEGAARILMERELAGHTVDAIAARAADAWDALLGRLELPDADETTSTLAATLTYRTLLFPRRIDEPGPDGRSRYRCPDTGEVRSGVRVADNGLWDTARTVYPWYSLLCPDVLPTLLEGWLEGARATGWLASWASPGHRTCMTGSYADAVFADAVSRGIGGFDPAEALHYLRRHAEEPVEDGTPYGREALDAYLEHGFVPVDRIAKATARTLDYAYGDWCLARVARAAGDRPFARECLERAQSWRHVLCPTTGFFRGRHRDGSWLAPFEPYAWGGPFVEGSAWQFAWHVPHHPGALIAARGGRAKARAFLQQLFDAPARYEIGSYEVAIHEMREMAAVDFGQYAHSNQPSHFTLPYFAHCGDPDAMAHWTHRVLTELYRPRPDGLPGDEDNGEMSAWWLCAALGLFPSCPGDGAWLTVTPLQPRAILRVPGQPELEIRRDRNDRKDRKDHPRDAVRRGWRGPAGEPVAAGGKLEHATLKQGGTWHAPPTRTDANGTGAHGTDAHGTDAHGTDAS